MDKKLSSELDSIFESHQMRKAQERKTADEREQRRQDFTSRFEQKVEEVIKPAFGAFAEYVKGKGVESRVEASQSKIDVRGGRQPAKASIRFIISERDTASSATDYPTFTFFCDPVAERVRLHRSTMTPGRGGQAGDIGTCTLDQITSEYVHSQLVTLLKAVLAP